MERAEHREPYDARVSRTVLGGPEGEIPSGYSTVIGLGTSPLEIEHIPLRRVKHWHKRALEIIEAKANREG